MGLAFRQVHLDFHTSEAIDGIGAKFSKVQFQQMLKVGHVDSITVFSKCHHGWAYHPSEANAMHPGLKFDLLSAQIEAAHEIGVKTPVYISAGFDQRMARMHPEWRVVMKNGGVYENDPLIPRYYHLCMNTPYLDLLMAQVEEVCRNYDADGIFLDIVNEWPCCCPSCLETMLSRGWDPADEANVRALAKETYARYTRRVRETIDKVKPGLPVFHNGGHIRHGRRDLAAANSHLELESLPTGGWGYDHFPLSAAYGRTLGMDMLGMTGKFHGSWGEFGGFKHKNALRYETALSLANGAKCSIGDQLHPNGEMDEATYRLIGAAYEEVEQKEAWCEDAVMQADIGIVSMEPYANSRNNRPNVGAARMMLEGKYLFDVLDSESDFGKYKVVILPDGIPMSDGLKQKLDAFTAAGGKLLVTGDSLLPDAPGAMAYDLGCVYEGPSAYDPAYLVPMVPLANMDPGTYVIYEKGNRVQVTADGVELARREQSYFNRTIAHFCSHKHAPNSGIAEGSAVTMGKHGAYMSWRVFTEYADVGSLINRDMVCAVLDRLLDGRKTLETDLPAQGVATLANQPEQHRLVAHLLYAVPVKRGKRTEVIEDIVPVYDVNLLVRTDKPVHRVYLAPEMASVPFTKAGSEIRIHVPCIRNHQMVVLDY